MTEHNIHIGRGLLDHEDLTILAKALEAIKERHEADPIRPKFDPDRLVATIGNRAYRLDLDELMGGIITAIPFVHKCRNCRWFAEYVRGPDHPIGTTACCFRHDTKGINEVRSAEDPPCKLWTLCVPPANVEDDPQMFRPAREGEDPLDFYGRLVPPRKACSQMSTIRETK